MTIAAAPPYHWRPSGGHAVQLLGSIILALLLFAFVGWSSLTEAQAAAPTRAEVKAAQQQLQELGLDPGAIDGAYGRKTHMAIKQFQRISGLDITGNLDAPTRAALRSQASPDGDTDSAHEADSEPSPEEQLHDLEQRVEELDKSLKTVDEALKTNNLAIVDNTARLDAELKQQVSGLNQGLTTGGKAIEGNRQTIAKQIERLDGSLKRIDLITLRLGSVAEQTQQHAQTLDKHQTQLKDNSVKLFETLISVDKAQQALEATRKLVHSALPEKHKKAASDPTHAGADLRLLLSSTLCLLVPLGALLHHGGFLGVAASADNRARSSADLGPTAWVVAAWVGAGLGFFLLGFGIMFGTSQSGWVGMPLHFFADLTQKALVDAKPALLTVLVPQFLLASIAGVIVCSAVPDRMSPLGHLIMALVVGGMIYPLFGHWASAEHLLSGNEGWLLATGFTPSDGATGVALLAGVAGLSLANGLRRMGAAAQQKQLASELTRWATPGVLLLWVAWYGVILAASVGEPPFASLLLATYLTTVGAVVAALVLNSLFSTDLCWQQRIAGAALAGLIAASGAYNTATATELVLLGLVAGGLHTLALHLLRQRLDHSVELSAIVAVGGLLGTLGPALFGPDGFLFVPSIDRILPQLLGLGAALLLAAVTGWLLAWPAQRWTKRAYAEAVA